MDVAQLNKALGPRTKAMFFAHTLGNRFQARIMTRLARDASNVRSSRANSKATRLYIEAPFLRMALMTVCVLLAENVAARSNGQGPRAVRTETLGRECRRFARRS
jgi:hypothetical protein